MDVSCDTSAFNGFCDEAFDKEAREVVINCKLQMSSAKVQVEGEEENKWERNGSGKRSMWEVGDCDMHLNNIV